MEDTRRNASHSSDELDLSALLASLLVFFRKNRSIFLITCFLSMAIATLICKLMTRTYTARMVIQSTIITSHEADEMISNWEQLLGPKGYPTLAREFNCPPQLLSSVSGIKTEIIITAGQTWSTFALEVNTTDTTVLPRLQQAIIYALRNNDYVKRRIDIRRSTLVEEIDQVKRQIARLDSAAGYIQSFHAKGAGSSYMLDVSKIPEETATLQDHLATYVEKLAFVDDMQVLQGFLLTRKVSPSLKIYLPLGLGLGLLIGYLFVLTQTARSLAKRK